MGQLPADHVEPARPFLKCGIDFAGPFLIKSSIRRNAPLLKGYVCIFVCFTTKAVHIELVRDLSTQAFISALNRFFDRRGKSITIYSDNATNFVGASHKLKEWYDLFQTEQHKKKVEEVLSESEVQWRFIPPRSPHFGGLWEAAVKSMKNIVQKTLGNVHLTYEELYTVLTRTEACLNSRPLTPISTDPNDLSVLTPGHFLIGDSLLAIPEPDIANVNINRLTRWRRLNHYSQIIWKKWSREYLNQLQERKRWAGEKGPKLEIGTVVLVRDENLSPLYWKLGRVTSVQRGPDEIIRSAEVKLEKGSITRAVYDILPDILPETCEAGVLILSKDIFYKLRYANTWIYTTRGETLTIACRGNTEPYIQKIKIKGSGNLVFTIPNKIKDINLPRLVIKEDNHKLERIHEIAHSLDEVQNMIDSEIEKQSGQDIINNKRNYLLQPRYEMVRMVKSKFYAETTSNTAKGVIQVEQEQSKGKSVLPKIK
ncbi:uncharacterized protein LOC132938501 [Metopolophium dirhodum]|uniref:uncharacterized protein LOC132938501 n=1 Tax=Metopolophium dirhodum TaxID=44670 RepID=UPI00298F52A9|nr:uncharacterized protein LOC132938501 [Metopolophium dirhodum]